MDTDKRDAGVDAVADRRAGRIADWIVSAGLRGDNEQELLEGLCDHLVSGGVSLLRATVSQRTLHPVFGAYASRWTRGGGVRLENFERASEDTDEWRRSPFAHMLENGLTELRVEIGRAEEPSGFPVVDALRGQGATDYIAFVVPWGRRTDAPERQGYASSWAVDSPGVFSPDDLSLIRQLLPTFGLAIKAAGMLRMGASLVETYLGHDAGWRVLRGDIRRGSMDVIDAVLWYCDIRGFTAAADWMPRHELIATLNDYLDCLARPVEERGGQILKFLGDGFLATFDLGQFGESGVCSAAMAALMAARSGLRVLDDERRSAGKPALQVDIALHHGEVLYGNIGSRNRLDFTVVGPAVNEVSRMETLCESLNQNVLVSRRFRDVARLSGCDRFLVSVGSHVLRGVREPQELFTVIETAIDPTAVGLNAGRDSAR